VRDQEEQGRPEQAVEYLALSAAASTSPRLHDSAGHRCAALVVAALDVAACAPARRQRAGILLRCSPCLPRTALPLSSRHRSPVPSIRAALQTTGRPPHAVNSSHLVPAWRRHRHRLLARAVGGRSPCDCTQKADRSRLRRQRESVRPVARVCESDGQIPVAAFHAVDPDGRIWSPLQTGPVEPSRASSLP